MNLLANFSQNLIDFAVNSIPSVQMEGIGYVIKWIFDLFTGFPAAIALGVIVFTVALKTLVLPLDIYSRVKTKKQSLLMKSMRPQMEKLQKQYANDKNMYSQKVMELQRAHGYNPLGACLPMIVSLVIFMVIFSSFSTYSNYATLMTYNNLVDAYNGSVVTFVMVNENDEIDKHFLLPVGEGGEDFTEWQLSDSGEAIVDGETAKIEGYRIDYDKFIDCYKVDNPEFDGASFLSRVESDKISVVLDYVKMNARAASADYYLEHRSETSFLWIGNMWYPDSAFNKEMPSFTNFQSSVSRATSGTSASYEESYNEVTANLGAQKNRVNGYFVLILLSIGSMFLQQFIMMRAQKDANELSTVDGSGAMQTKWMMIIMPIIFGIFSFMYSAAFSVYMIINTIYGLVSTLIINKIVTVRYENKEAQAALSTRYGKGNKNGK